MEEELQRERGEVSELKREQEDSRGGLRDDSNTDPDVSRNLHSCLKEVIHIVDLCVCIQPHGSTTRPWHIY
jgi:hypothetical protein